MESRVLQLSLRADPLSTYAGGAVGGQQVLVQSVARAVQGFGFGVDVMAAAGPREPARVALGPLGRVVRIPLASWPTDEQGWADRLPELTAAARRWIAEQGRRRYHVLHSYSWVSGAVAAPLARELGVPWVHSPGLVPTLEEAGAEPVTLVARQLMEADAVVVGSRQAARRVLAWAPGARVTVIPPGVDPNTFFPREPGPALRRLGLPRRAILVVTGSLPGRSTDTTAAVLAWWRARRAAGALDDACWLLLIGPDTEQLTADADHIRGFGRVPHRLLPSYFAAAAVTIVPSLETHGLTALESMASGVPVVGYRVAGLEDVVVDGETGYLVTPGDADALAARAVALWADGPTARRMGALAEQHVLAGYTLQHLGEAFAALYRTVSAGDVVTAQA